MRAVYVEVERPAKVVWREVEADGGRTTAVTFTDLSDGRTEVVTHQTHIPAAYLADRAREGFGTSLDRFASFVLGLSRH